LLSEDSDLLEGLHSADKTKMHEKSKVTKCTHFYWKRKPLSCLFTSCFHILADNDESNELKLVLNQLCKRQSADTSVLIGRYRLSAKRPIISMPIIGAWRASLLY